MKLPFNLDQGKVIKGLKIAGMAVGGLFLLIIAVGVVGGITSGLRMENLNIMSGGGSSVSSYAPASEMAYDEKAMNSDAGMAVGLSVRNVAPSPIVPPTPGGQATVGGDAEEYEAVSYNATVETRRLAEDCGAIAALKSRPEVVFESANETEHSCYYSFKVEKDKAAEVLAVVKGLDPRDLIEGTETLKPLVQDFTSQEDILKKKLAAIDETLVGAMKAYDEITRVATSARDAESLARIVDSKIKLIERLSQERLNVSAQLESLGREKARQLDRLDYTYFRVNVYENKFVDGQAIRDSWKAAVKNAIAEANRSVQDLTVGLVVLLLGLFQGAIYLLLGLVTVKYGWRLAKRIWKA